MFGRLANRQDTKTRELNMKAEYYAPITRFLPASGIKHFVITLQHDSLNWSHFVLCAERETPVSPYKAGELERVYC